MESFSKLLWNEAFWLPVGFRWKDMENKPGSRIYIPQREDMVWSLLGGLVLLVIRYFLEYFITTPLGYKLGVKQKKRLNLSPNPVLEDEFKKNGLVSNSNLEAVAKKADLSVREVERWLRDRQEISKPADIQRFNECCWHFLFYSSSFTYGLVVLWNKPWFWELKLCWTNYPLMDVRPEIYWYYMIELSFYWCLVYTTLTDHKRKDFGQMIVHHIVTIFLIFFSWAVNGANSGSLIMLAHDVGDIPMAFAKMMKYCGKTWLTDIFMVVFVVTWILSRLAYFPFVIIRSFIFYGYFVMGICIYFFIGLLVVLQVLHIIWTYMIARIVVKMVSHGKVSDVRSDSESDE